MLKTDRGTRDLVEIACDALDPKEVISIGEQLSIDQLYSQSSLLQRYVSSRNLACDPHKPKNAVDQEFCNSLKYELNFNSCIDLEQNPKSRMDKGILCSNYICSFTLNEPSLEKIEIECTEKYQGDIKSFVCSPPIQQPSSFPKMIRCIEDFGGITSCTLIEDLK